MRATPEAIDAFDPLLRDLVLWGLVTKIPGDNGPRWELTPEAQRRMSEVVATRVTPPVERLVYLGRRCVVCRKRALTRLREQGYVCDSCAHETGRTVMDGTPVGAVSDGPDHRHGRHIRGKGRSLPGTPLAS